MSSENMASLFRIRKIARKPTLKAKEIREELAANFLSGGRVESGKMTALKGGTFFLKTSLL
jgi:hypothetical protein